MAHLSARARIAAALLLFLAVAASGTFWYAAQRERAFFDPRILLSRFPAEEALAAGIDFTTLRAAGLLGPSKSAPEAEYRQFLEGTGFDYRRDLDSLTAAFSQSGSYFIARGRFDWPRLRAYAIGHGGSCYQDLCRLQGSRPERHISFLPLRSDAIALAVSTNDLAATLLTRTGQPVASPIPAAPVWISVPGTELRRQNALPPGMHLMLSALTSADRILITVGPATAGMEAKMKATCRTKDDAMVLASQLRIVTATLREALTKGRGSSGDEVAALLTGGSFDQTDRLVTGRWPVRKSLLDALTDGI